MADDMFDLGPTDEESTETEDDRSTGGSPEVRDSSPAVDSTNERENDYDPLATPAINEPYQENQHTAAALDDTWNDVIDIIEDAKAHARLEGLSDVKKLEVYEALFRIVSDEIDAEDVARRVQTLREEQI